MWERCEPVRSERLRRFRKSKRGDAKLHALEERNRRLRVLSWKFPLQTMKLERMGELSDGDREDYRSLYYLSITDLIHIF